MRVITRGYEREREVIGEIGEVIGVITRDDRSDNEKL